MAVGQRHIAFERVYNFRDLGGYPTTNGRSVRWRRLFRSSEPQRLSEVEAGFARSELGIVTVIDLRADYETPDPRGFGPLVAQGATRHHLPMWNDRVGAIAASPEAWGSGEGYMAMLDHASGSIVAATRLLASEPTYAAIFHCKGGKDRTGVLAALVLSALGVDEETIVADYMLTDEHMEHRARVEAQEHAEGLLRYPPETPSRPLESRIRGVMRLWRERFGSARAYLLAQGMADDELEALERALLD